MLKQIAKVFCVIVLLPSCSTIKPPPTEATTEPTTIITINDHYAQQLPENTSQYFTEYNASFSCDLTTTAPLQAEPNWVTPTTIWQRIRPGLQLDHNIENSRLTAEFNWYQKNPKYMARVSERSHRYIYHVVEQLEQHNMPLELALLPIVESAYDPFAYSHGRASGMWQFIPSTGRAYKLEQDWWYDGRRDITASTQAAITYLQALNKTFDGDWLLALAAYNSGQGTVNKAIRKNRSKGKATDFWSLDLPRETRSYVPKLLALAKIINTPRRYHIDLFPVENKPYFAAVDTQSQIDLAQAATMAGIDIDELYRLNPGYNRWATSPDGPHQLLVPIEQQAVFEQALGQLDPSQRMHWQRYTVQNGDVLSILAKRFNTDVTTIKQANGMSNNTIVAGKALMIPTASKQQQHYSLSSDERLSNIKQQRNGGENTNKIVHRVASGESFWTIAKHYQVSVSDLAHWNGMAPRDLLQIGQQLNVWSTQVSNPIAQRDKIVKKVGYKVRSGDSLARIADKFNIHVKDIIDWNRINTNKYLQPGQSLTLYIDIMNAVN